MVVLKVIDFKEVKDIPEFRDCDCLMDDFEEFQLTVINQLTERFQDARATIHTKSKKNGAINFCKGYEKGNPALRLG